MMTQPKSDQEAFQDLLQGHFDRNVDNVDSLAKVRAHAWERFVEMGLPHRRTEVFRYIRLPSLFSQLFGTATATALTPAQITPFVCAESKESLLVFVNGHYQEHLSNTAAITRGAKAVVVLPLAEAMGTYGAFLNNRWSKALREETDPFALLNAALHRDGLFVYVPPKCIVSAPLQILSIVDIGNKQTVVMPRLQIFVGAHAEVSLISSTATLSGERYWINQATDIVIDDGAKVVLNQMAVQDEADVWNFDAVRVTLKKNGSFKSVNLSNGNATSRFDYRATLTGENSEALLNGAWMLRDRKEHHVNIVIDHQAPNCHSMQLFKGALADFGRSSFEGKIMVRREAQKTDAFQRNNNLLLSDKAHADSKPNLEIFADDVKASHGATIGQLDKEQLFYLRARGYSESAAKELLVDGFLLDVIDQISIPSLREQMAKRLLKKSNAI